MKLKIHNVIIPNETLSVTNWFSLKNMATKHDIKCGSSEHLEMIRRYAKAMRRTRQTHFYISFEWSKVIVDLEKYEFDFSYLKPIIEIFFEEGFKTMEMGPFATQYDDLFTDELKSAFNPKVKISSDEGYYITLQAVKTLAEFLEENNWKDKVIFHICDEPDVHINNEMAMLKRKEQYFKITNILRKNIPNAKIIEAIKTAEFKAGIDIFVPLTVNLEQFMDEFDRLNEVGNEIWTYVCCCPSGKYLNRFIDSPLICSRLIFWGCSKYNLSGYLHWGLNHFIDDFDPFKQTCCPNNTGHGTSFPSGDSFIVYPGSDGPWISMRLEAQRKGIEDFELLKLVKDKDINAYNQIMDKIFTNNKEYNLDINEFETIRIHILELLEG